MLKDIICAVAGLWCVQMPYGADWRTKVITGPSIPDIVAQVPACHDWQDNAAMINAALENAKRIRDVSSPMTDAAAWSTEGVSVEVRLSGDKPCRLRSAIFMSGTSTLNGNYVPLICESVCIEFTRNDDDK